jgi:hypothetical protein
MAITNPSPTFPQFPGDAAAVTLSDTTRFDPSVIYACTTGDVSVVTSQGSTVLFTAVPAGAIIPVRVIGVRSTGTTVGITLVRIF